VKEYYKNILLKMRERDPEFLRSIGVDRDVFLPDEDAVAPHGAAVTAAAEAQQSGAEQSDGEETLRKALADCNALRAGLADGEVCRKVLENRIDSLKTAYDNLLVSTAQIEVDNGIHQMEINCQDQIKQAQGDCQEQIKRMEIDCQEQIKRMEIDFQEKMKLMEIDCQEQIKRMEIDCQEQIKRMEIDCQEKMKLMEIHRQEIDSQEKYKQMEIDKRTQCELDVAKHQLFLRARVLQNTPSNFSDQCGTWIWRLSQATKDMKR
jgi:hypothetical protein